MAIDTVKKVKIIPNYIYFYHLDEFFIIPLYPDSIQDNLKSTFAQTNALSRSAPVFTYSNSGPRDITVNFSLHRDLMNDINKDISNVKMNMDTLRGDDYIDTLIKYLQTVALPKYNVYKSGSKSVQPPEIAIRFGSDIFIKGVVTSGININYKKPIINGDKYALVDISFSVSETTPYDADSVKRAGSFRGCCDGGANDINLKG